MRVALTLLPLILFSCGQESSLVAKRAISDQRVLLVSINDYPFLPGLDGPNNDMDALARTMRERFGFHEEAITHLRDEAAHHQAILDGLQMLVDIATPEMQVVFAFAGHGSYVADDNAEESDGRDETLVPYNSDKHNRRDIRDDLLYGYFQQILDRGAYLTVIIDACHSGNLAKADGSRQRTVPPAPYADSAKMPLTGLNTHGRFVFLAAAQEHETANERALSSGLLGQKSYYGSFSRALIQSLQTHETSRRWGVRMAEIRRQIRAVEEEQVPVLKYGEQIRPFGIRQVVLGQEIYVSQVQKRQQTVSFSQGRLAGIKQGSIVAVYHPNQNMGETGQPLACFMINALAPNRSSGVLIGNSGDNFAAIREGYPALHKVAADESTWRLLLDEGLPAVLKSNLRSRLLDDRVGLFNLAGDRELDGEQVHIRSRRDEKGTWVHLIGSTLNERFPYDPGQPDTTIDAVMERLGQTVKARRLWQVHHLASGEPPLGICLERIKVRFLGDVKEGLPRPLHSETGLNKYRVGDFYRISYENQGPQPLYVSVLLIGADDRIQLVNDDQYDAALNPGQRLQYNIEIKPPLGRERLKVIICSEPGFDPTVFLSSYKAVPGTNQLPSNQTWWTIEQEYMVLPTAQEEEASWL